MVCPLCPLPQPVTITPPHVTAPAYQELSAAHCAQDTTQHDPVPSCNGSSKHNEEDNTICIICCHCPGMFLYSVGRQTQSQDYFGFLICSKLPLPRCCVMA